MTKQQQTWGLVADAILRGEHDGDLSKIEQAVARRKKAVLKDTGIRAHARVNVAVDKRSGPYAGKDGVVTKVNKIRAIVAFPCPDCGRTEATRSAVEEGLADDACHTCFGFPDEAGIPFDLLTVAS